MCSKSSSKDPYVVGSDFIGEEINDIEDLKPAIKQIVQDIAYYDKGFTVRIHAGENDSLKDNVEKSIKMCRTIIKTRTRNAKNKNRTWIIFKRSEYRRRKGING